MLDELVGGPLRLIYAPFDIPARLTFHVLDASLTALAHLTRAFGKRLGLPRGFDRSLLGLASSLRGVVRAPGADLDGVADRRGVDDGCRHLPPTVACAGWPAVDDALLVEDSVTAVVQVQGKLRARLQVSPDISETDLEAAALADKSVQRSLEGKQVRKVIVRAPKLVNVVV